MIKNYLIVAIRNIRRNKVYSLINVSGLAVGMASFLLIMIWVMDELSYDQFHANVDYLYRIEQDQNYSGSIYHVNVTPYPMAAGVKAEIPEVKYATPYPHAGTLLLRFKEKSFFERRARAVTPDFLKMFSYTFIQGDPLKALDEPASVIITQEIAQKYFGDDNPIGKVITINNQFDFKVSGVLENLPTNSVIRFDILLPFEFLKDLGRTIDNWGWNSIVTYVQLHEDADVESVNEKITELRRRRSLELIKDDPESLKRAQEDDITPFMLRPLADIHLRAYWGYNKSMGNILYIYIFAIIAVFIIILASINFMNLATARSIKRAREVGMRKVVGARKENLILQFYGESIIMAFLGLTFALLIVALLLPSFGKLADKSFEVNILWSWEFLLGMIVLTLITGILSGSYPAMFLSAFQPIKILSGRISGSGKGALFRKVLVVFQFTISLILIVSTILIYNQLQFMKEMDLGFDQEHLIYIPLRGDTNSHYAVLKNELLKDKKIVNVTGTNFHPSHIGSNSSGVDWDGKDPNLEVLVSMARVSFDYIETMKIELVEGRSFSKKFTSDTANAYLINEEMARIMGGGSVVNKRFDFSVEGTIVGVMKDFHYQSVREQIEPLAIQCTLENIYYVLIRLSAGNIPEAIEFVESTWKRIVPDYPFVYRFLEEDLNDQYVFGERISDLLKYFAILAIVIACLGLFGLASFTAEQRTKEMGIRKVLGASIGGLIVLMSRDFTKWVLIANLIAWPVSWYAMDQWLNDFAYRIPIGWETFVLAAITTLLIALLTVLYQSVRAATANPADSIKYE
jgi:ABC-type antimicrobial peptide transport system permease subunit